MASGDEHQTPSQAKNEDENDCPIRLEQLVISEQYLNEGVRLILQPLRDEDWKSVQVRAPKESLKHISLPVNQTVASESKGNAEVLEATVIAVTQTSVDIKFSVLLPNPESKDFPVSLDFYYDPFSDNVILRNLSDVPIGLITFVKGIDKGPTPHSLDPTHCRSIRPSIWSITCAGRPIMDVKNLPRPRSVVALRPSLPAADNEQHRPQSLKRPHPASQEGDLPAPKRQEREPSQIEKESQKKDGYATQTAEPNGQGQTLITKPEPSFSHPRILHENETLEIPGIPGQEKYQIVRQKRLMSSRLADVYLARHSSLPDVIVVKVLKTVGSGKRSAIHRSVVSQAETWLREYTIQKQLQHDSVVQLMGGDARFLTLYLEYIPAQDLTKFGVWRDSEDYFLGKKDDAVRIWADISGALEYVHEQGIEHNDIKPSNIIYSDVRGAVLCDFGISCARGLTVSGGTPFYIPPEYLTKGIRGTAADIWSFGITMLYVLRHTFLPDARGRPSAPKKLYWQISDIHTQPNPHNQDSAAHKMLTWLKEIADIKANLKEEDDPSYILRDMLELDPRHRVSATELKKRLDHERTLKTRQVKPKAQIQKKTTPVSIPSKTLVPRPPDYGSATEECTATSQGDVSGND